MVKFCSHKSSVFSQPAFSEQRGIWLLTLCLRIPPTVALKESLWYLLKGLQPHSSCFDVWSILSKLFLSGVRFRAGFICKNVQLLITLNEKPFLHGIALPLCWSTGSIHASFSGLLRLCLVHLPICHICPALIPAAVRTLGSTAPPTFTFFLSHFHRNIKLCFHCLAGRKPPFVGLLPQFSTSFHQNHPISLPGIDVTDRALRNKFLCDFLYLPRERTVPSAPAGRKAGWDLRWPSLEVCQLFQAFQTISFCFDGYFPLFSCSQFH